MDMPAATASRRSRSTVRSASSPSSPIAAPWAVPIARTHSRWTSGRASSPPPPGRGCFPRPRGSACCRSSSRADELVAMALDMGAPRVEIAHVQYYGWALKNRAVLMPTRQQVVEAVGRIEPLRKQHHGRIVIDAVVPDYYARFPKPCVGGWGRRSLNVTPAGRVLPCHAAESIPGLEFWSVKEHSLREIWEHNPAFNPFPR